MRSAPTLPGPGGEKWAAGVRVREAKARKGARPQPRILGQREKKHRHSQSGVGRPLLSEMERGPQIPNPWAFLYEATRIICCVRDPRNAPPGALPASAPAPGWGGPWSLDRTCPSGTASSFLHSSPLPPEAGVGHQSLGTFSGAGSNRCNIPGAQTLEPLKFLKPNERVVSTLVVWPGTHTPLPRRES